MWVWAGRWKCGIVPKWKILESEIHGLTDLGWANICDSTSVTDEGMVRTVDRGASIFRPLSP